MTVVTTSVGSVVVTVAVAVLIQVECLNEKEREKEQTAGFQVRLDTLSRPFPLGVNQQSTTLLSPIWRCSTLACFA